MSPQNRLVSFAFGPVLFASLLGLSGLAPAAHAAGRVSVRYDEPKSEGLVVVMESLQESKLFEKTAAALNSTLKLPVNLPIVGAECDTINAFYDPEERTITICYELLDYYAGLHVQAAEQVSPDGEVDGDEIITAVLGATEFVLYHEIGHALIDLLELPVTGREEDAVDQLAAVVLLSAEDDASTQAALDGAYAFLLQGEAAKQAQEDGEEAVDESDYADEHSLDPQRFYNITCWVLGSDPDGFSGLVDSGLMPEARAVRCPQEWAQTSRAWATLLGPYLKK